jgi:hypothetical protein
MELATAQQVERILRDANGRLNDALLVIQADCSAEEFEEYRTQIGRIMGAIVVDFLQPIYAQYPETTPPELQSGSK